MTFCERHRMPAGTHGCPQCAREEATSRRAESARFWRWAALVFGSIAFAGVLTVLFAPSKGSSQFLDPEPFRPAIVKVEGALYSTERLTFEQRDTLAVGLYELETAIRKLPPSLARRRAQDPFSRFCLVTAVEAKEDGFDVPAARLQWEALRRAHFKAAPWFRVGSRALQQAQASAGARGIPADAHLYQPAIDKLRLVQARAENELQSLPQDTYEVDSSTYERWTAARAEVQADLERLRLEYPVAFDGMDPAWRRALQDLEDATRAVGALMAATANTPSLVPAGGQGELRIRRARAEVDQVQASLDAAPR